MTTLKNQSLTFLTFLLIVSCGQKTPKDDIENKSIKNQPPLLMKNATICDTCECQLKVAYVECTGSLDFAVYSGTVFIPSKLFKSMTDILNLDSTLERPINTIDFLFSDNNDFEKLWPSSERYTTGWKDYIIKGRVCGFNYIKRDYWPHWQLELVFSLKDYKAIDTDNSMTKK